MRNIAVHLAVAGGVCDGVFCAVFFPRVVLDKILDLTVYDDFIWQSLVVSFLMASFCAVLFPTRCLA